MEEISQKLKDAFSFHQNGDFVVAQKLYLELLNENPSNSKVLDLLGVLFYQTKIFDKAEECLKKAIEISPQISYIEDLAKLYLDTKHYELSIKLYESVLTQNKTFENYFNLAMGYKNINQNKKARENYYNALNIDSTRCETYINLAYIDIFENNISSAINHYKKTLEINPNDVEVRYFLALAQMQNKDYKNGLQNFEARLCKNSAILSQEKLYPTLMKEKPIWQGENLKDKILYTYYEAGFGDIIMMYRYMPILTKICKKVIFKPQNTLTKLFKENSYGAEIVEQFEDTNKMYFDYHIPFLSIPLVLKYFDENIFINHEGYLKANREKTHKYKQKYCDNNNFKIGFKWKGKSFYDTERILKVEDFVDLFKLPNTNFYSFQTGAGIEELDKIRQKYDITDLGATFSDFSDTASAIDNMDLIISNDTSLVHLAGAMGKACFVLLPYISNWRWHTDISECDWYDSVKIFKQENLGNWENVFNEVLNELKNK